ncbi:MAG TPA: DsbA family oxidoreductase [Cyclobacteriaceae bacterium]|nr:DsbA family oxidoreductase [Cyclobacteriaceae bacterium]
MNKKEQITKIKIDVVSDVVCPWCYIGKRRLENALSRLPEHIQVDINFLPFELNPDTPKAGTDHKSYLADKFGSMERYHQLTDHVTNVAAGEGLKFDYEKQSVIPNTLDSHRLIQYAKEFGKQPEMKEALMKAYFEQGIDLSKQENLVEIAGNVGLEKESTRKYLSSEKGIQEVKQMEQLSYRRGVSGVPFYIINDKYGVSGAQPSDAFLDILTSISSQEQAVQD